MFRMSDEVRGASKISASNIESISKRLLSKKELALVLGVSPRLLDNWVAQKRIPFLRLSARLIRFNAARVLEVLARYEIREVGRRV